MADGSRPKMNVEDPIRDEPALGLAHEGEGTKEGPTSFSESPQPRDSGRRALVAWLRERVAGHENATLGGICGLAVALLVFSVGILRALFVVLCVSIGVIIGQAFDGNPKVIRALRRIFSDNR